MRSLLEISPILAPGAMIVPAVEVSDNAKRWNSHGSRLEMVLRLFYKEEDKQDRQKDNP
jgi:hypothetical protein